MNNHPANKEIGYNSRRSAYWSISLKIVQQLYHFGVTIVVARILGPENLGIMAIAMALVEYANSVTGFGFTSALVQKHDLDNKLIDTVFTLNFIASLSLVPIVLYLLPNVTLLLNAKGIENIVPYLLIILPLASFYNIPMALLRRDLDFKKHSIIDLCHNIVVSTTMLVLALLDYGIWSLVYSQIAGYGFVAVSLLLFGSWKPRLSFSFGLLRNVANFGFWDTIRFHINYVEQYASYFVTSKFLNPTILGYYDRATAISSMPQRMIQMQLGAVLFASFSRIQHEPDRLIRAFNKSFTAFALIVFPISLGIASIAPYFVHIFLGEKWLPMIVPLQILCIAGIFRMFCGVMRNINVAVNAYQKMTIANVISVSIYVILCFVGVKNGMTGVATVTLISAFLTFLYYGHLTINSLKIDWSSILLCILPALSASFMMAGMLTLLSKTLCAEHTLNNLIILITAGTVTYAGLVMVIPAKSVKTLLDDFYIDIKAKLGGRNKLLNKDQAI